MSAAGLACALLNRNADDTRHWRRSAGLQSRGVVVPQLLNEVSAAEAVQRLERMDLSVFAPFTLLAIDDHQVFTAAWDGQAVSSAQTRVAQLPMWASSGYGDEHVIAPRAAWFADQVKADPTPAQQDAFHLSRLGSDPVCWVAMARSDARTVSQTVITSVRGTVALDYAVVHEDGTRGPVHRQQLDCVR